MCETMKTGSVKKCWAHCGKNDGHSSKKTTEPRKAASKYYKKG